MSGWSGWGYYSKEVCTGHYQYKLELASRDGAATGGHTWAQAEIQLSNNMPHWEKMIKHECKTSLRNVVDSLS
jgi:hypothetical protein